MNAGRSPTTSSSAPTGWCGNSATGWRGNSAANSPWALKTYDGREKSLLRGAVRDVLPESVVQRVKSPYPQTQDAQYPAALQQQAKERLARPGHPVFELVSHDWLTGAVQADPASIPMRVRNGLERALDLAMWLDIYQPDLRLP